MKQWRKIILIIQAEESFESFCDNLQTEAKSLTKCLAIWKAKIDLYTLYFMTFIKANIKQTLQSDLLYWS